MKELPPGLSKKADEVLMAFGGLKGLADQPAWLVAYVLKSFFPEEERKTISEHLKQR